MGLISGGVKEVTVTVDGGFFSDYDNAEQNTVSDIKAKVADLKKYVAGVRKMSALQRMALSGEIADNVIGKISTVLDSMADAIESSAGTQARVRRHQATLYEMVGQSNSTEAARLRAILEDKNDG